MDASNAGDAGLAFGILACYGIFFLVWLALFILNIWMLIDSIQRQEYEYPGSTGNSKNLWVIILAVGLVLGFGGIAGLIYFFMVFKKIKRGTVAPPQMQQQYAPAPQGYVPPAPPMYQPPAPPMYQPPAAPMTPPMAPPAPPMAPPMAPPAAPMTPPEMPAPPMEPMAAPEMPPAPMEPPMAPPEMPMPPSEPPAE